jgi:hypothetical protein
MQRLAIIDVAGGDHPIFNEDRSVVVVMTERSTISGNYDPNSPQEVTHF